jgi:hypothetical protein
VRDKIMRSFDVTVEATVRYKYKSVAAENGGEQAREVAVEEFFRFFGVDNVRVERAYFDPPADAEKKPTAPQTVAVS